MANLDSESRRVHPNPLRGLLQGAVCGACIGVIAFGPPAYVDRQLHPRIWSGPNFFRAHGDFEKPYEAAISQALVGGLVFCSLGAIVGLCVGVNSHGYRLAGRGDYLVGTTMLVIGACFGWTLHADEDVVALSIYAVCAALAGFLGWRLFRIWLNREFKDVAAIDDFGEGEPLKPSSSDHRHNPQAGTVPNGPPALF